MPSGKRETERKGNAPVNTGPSPNSDGHADNRVEEADEPARGSGPLHTDKRENSQLEIRKVFKSANAIIILELASTPVRGAVQVCTCGACFCIRLEMDPTECLKKLKDFFCPSGVSTSNYGLVVRYLLSDSESRDLYLVGQARESSFEELKRELLNTYGSKKSSVELIECIHALRQLESQIIKQCAEEVAKLGRRT
ncbi:hypothetical protein T01_7204 [Trichinella spiralis]|uniref:Uncharacterized protein n=1 Tax=Trichinella spiralis TaxID=6334 RepID=A0A0V1BX72_TRISP|nr:hypothetical protein T01_7204 [Trichinella spiralis]